MTQKRTIYIESMRVICYIVYNNKQKNKDRVLEG